ncbi:MAG TPA: hypothetical protein VF179_05955 [Thermoanaerobaculia bacterium]|nr:hypothetical protein [Thermoanaerobaculia bacterium]
MTAWTPVDLLPGLYAGGLAILLWSGLRRWYDAVPARVLAVFSVVLLILFGPVLFGGKLLVPLDNLRGLTPFHRLPEVEPHGNLLQGDLILLIQPSLAAVRIELGEGRWPLWNPWVGAGMPLLADPQSQALQPIALAALPMPWQRAAGVMATLRVLLALTFSFLWMRRQGLGEGPSLAGALAFGLGGFVILWVGWPMASSAALLPAVLYGLVRCRQEGGRRDFLLLSLATFALLLGGHPETILYALGLCLIFDVKRMAPALVLAGALAAPALLPFVDYLPQTLRASRDSAPQMGTLAEHWLPIVAPNAYGNSRYVEYWGLNNTNEDAAGFSGTVTLLAVLLGLWAGRRFPQERLFLAVAVVCLLLLSPWGPGTRRLLLPLAFSLSYLGACTLERVRLGEVRRWTVILAAVALGAVIAWGYLSQEGLESLRMGSLHWQGRFLVLGTLLLFFGKRWTAPAAAVLIAAELLVFHLPANPPMPQGLANVPNGPIRFLQDHLEDYRMAALGRSFPPNTPLLYGLPDARVYNPMAPAEYLDRLKPILAGWWGEIPELGYRGQEDTPVYQDLGVRYLLTDPGVRLPLRLAFRDRDGWIYEIPHPRRVNREPVYRPRAFLLGCLLAALGLAAGAAWLVPPPTAPISPTRSEEPG